MVRARPPFVLSSNEHTETQGREPIRGYLTMYKKSTLHTRASFLSFSFLCVEKYEKEEHDSLRGGGERRKTNRRKPAEEKNRRINQIYMPRGKFVVPGFYRCAVPPSTEPTSATMTGSVQTLIVCIFVLHVLCNVLYTRTFFLQANETRKETEDEKT